VQGSGVVAAVLAADSTVKSPTEAAEHVLMPIFTRAFNGCILTAAS
jgi:hypothetical protein